MKLTNFEFRPDLAVNPDIEVATVTVITGILFWKKYRTKVICKDKLLQFWFFQDTGEYTPGVQAETLERAARTRLSK